MTKYAFQWSFDVLKLFGGVNLGSRAMLWGKGGEGRAEGRSLVFSTLHFRFTLD